MKPIYNLKNIKSEDKINYKASLDGLISSPQYFYSYSYDFAWVKKNTNVIMHYSIKDYETLTLYDNELHIQREEKLHIFDIKEVNDLKFEFKYLIIPLIVGGIVLSLSLVGIFSAVVERWAGMLLVTIGVILLYFGIRGTYQFSVQTFTNTFSFFIEDKDDGLLKFIDDFKNFNRRWIMK